MHCFIYIRYITLPLIQQGVNASRYFKNLPNDRCSSPTRGRSRCRRRGSRPAQPAAHTSEGASRSCAEFPPSRTWRRPERRTAEAGPRRHRIATRQQARATGACSTPYRRAKARHARSGERRQRTVFLFRHHAQIKIIPVFAHVPSGQGPCLAQRNMAHVVE